MSKEPVSKEPTTYVANVRVSIKHLASIAMFYASQNEHKGTLSKLASAIIISGAEMTSESFPIETVTEAVKILQNLNYEDLYKPTAKHNKSLFRVLGMESKQKIKQDSNMTIIKAEMAKKTPVVLPTTNAAKSQMTPEETAELTEKETSDVKSLRKAMKI